MPTTTSARIVGYDKRRDSETFLALIVTALLRRYIYAEPQPPLAPGGGAAAVAPLRTHTIARTPGTCTRAGVHALVRRTRRSRKNGALDPTERLARHRKGRHSRIPI